MELSRKRHSRWRSMFAMVGALLAACTACCLPLFSPALAWLGAAGAAALIGPWGALAAGALVLLLMWAKHTRQHAGDTACADNACTTCCSPQAKRPAETQTLQPPVACTLSAVDFKERAKWLNALKERALISYRVEGSCAYLVYKQEAEADVVLMVRQEQACCSFLRFDLRRTAAALELAVIAPPDAGGDAHLLFAHLIPSR